MLILCSTSVNKIRNEKDNKKLDGYISRIAENDREALSALYCHVKDSIFAFALSILKNAQDAEDILHDCFLSINASAAGYRSQGKPMAWIITITKNLCLMKIRERNRQADFPEDDWLGYIEDRPELTAEDRLVIAECMNSLSDTERQIIILHAVSGLKHREIAGFLGIPISTVLSKYNRALKKLKALITAGEIKS